MLNQSTNKKEKKIKINEAKKKTFFSKDWLYQETELNGQSFFLRCLFISIFTIVADLVFFVCF